MAPSGGEAARMLRVGGYPRLRLDVLANRNSIELIEIGGRGLADDHCCIPRVHKRDRVIGFWIMLGPRHEQSQSSVPLSQFSDRAQLCDGTLSPARSCAV
jgi:hypothetical protein